MDRTPAHLPPPVNLMVDLGLNNLRSIDEAFRRVGAPLSVLERPTDEDRWDLVVLPGVGAFGEAARVLEARGWRDALLRHVARGRPLLGICLGMQLLADESEEHGRYRGLGLVPGRVVRLEPLAAGERVPNMGWCDVRAVRRGFFRGGGGCFYFAHSFHLRPAAWEDVSAVFTYGGGEVTAAVERGRVAGVQFHPEKSQDDGLDLLESYVRGLA